MCLEESWLLQPTRMISNSAAAGTIARWIKAGSKAAYVLCTSGDVGIDENGMTRERAREIRELNRSMLLMSWEWMR